MLTRLCSSSDPLARPVQYDGQTMFVKDTHVGCVLSTYEKNGYDDSDFYAIVWEESNGSGFVQHIQYATTRFWTYAASANRDATPEVIAKARAFEQRCREDADNRLREIQDASPKNGDVVMINGYKRGRKVELNGQEAMIFWIGRNSFRPDCDSIGVEFSNGNREFVDADRAWKDGKTCESLINALKTERFICNSTARPSF